MKSFHEELKKKYENHYSSLGLKNLTELVNKRIKGEVGKEQAKEIKKYLKLSGKILDVGCGTAEFLVKVASHCEVYGIGRNISFLDDIIMKHLAKKDVEVKNAAISSSPHLSNLASYISRRYNYKKR